MKFKILFTLLLLISCQTDKKKNKETNNDKSSNELVALFNLPKKLNEISGIVANKKGYLAITDSGGGNVVYQLDSLGKITNEITVSFANNDWEDIISDGNTIFIGDFGNNDNDRKDLSIIRKSIIGNINAETIISFSYPEQTKFPPKKNEMMFDAEGFILLDNKFYIFTKNRNKDFDGTFYVYEVPNEAGKHEAKKVTEFKTCFDFKGCAITSATINNRTETIYLLSHDKIFELTNFLNGFDKANLKTIELNHNSQKESICVLNDSTLIIADEKVGKKGGKVYYFKHIGT